MGSAPGWKQMVPESTLADVLPDIPAHSAAAFKSDYDARPLVCVEPGVRGHLRHRGHLFFWVGGVLVFGALVVFLDRVASGRRSLDPGALHKRPQPGDLQLLWPD